MEQYKPPELTKIALAELKRDLNKQIHETESHLTKLRSLLSELEEQNTLLQEIIIISIEQEKSK